MTKHDETEDDRAGRGERGVPEGPPRPGLVLVWSGGRPFATAVALVAGALEIGREGTDFGSLPDPLVSRRHARVTREHGRFFARDLGSRNGTAIDGLSLVGAEPQEATRVVRTGGSIFLACADIRPYLAGVHVTKARVTGHALRRAWESIARAAMQGGSLHVTGESGVGKELAAQAFHDASPRARGPFVAVNCAAIPEGLAERLLFGAAKGAYSGALADADGYVQAANGGTLFLDEVGELALPVQAKFLRVLETREVTPLGATRSREVSLGICSATHRDLRGEVAAKRLREDFYFRIARPEVAIPPLRERLEEIPWLVKREVERAAGDLAVHASFVETCMLRPWPGNVRELLTEVRAASLEAKDSPNRELVAACLPVHAGQRMMAGTTTTPVEASASTKARLRGPTAPGKAELETLMRQHAGVIQEVAGALACSRRQVGRWLEEHQIDRDQFRGGPSKNSR